MNRRQFLNRVVISITGLTLADLNRTQLLSQNLDSRPNIVLIMADDMGFSDIGCYGSEIKTPNLDHLAASGLQFTQFYNYARCCPTRASLLTGLYPHQAGIGHMTSENDWTLKRNDDIGDVHYQGFLNRRCATIAEVLKLADYQTFMTGKWHVGTYKPNWPNARGFDRYFGIIRGAANYFNPDPEKRLLLDNEPFGPLPDDFYTTDYFSKYAAKFIREADLNRPFFLYTAYNAPHWPLHAWPKDIKKYEGKYMIGWDQLRQRRFLKQKELGLFSEDLELSPRDKEASPWEEFYNKREWDRRMAVYAAMIDRMDQGIGEIIKALKDIGEMDNTLILFLSDNGGCAEHYNPKPDIPSGPPESNTAYYLPWANASNTPFRLFKHWTHEGGISSPFIAHWPKQIKNKGLITNNVGTVIDIMPTILDAVNIKYPSLFYGHRIQPLEGESLLSLLKGEEKNEHSPIFWEHEGNRAVRDGKWKLVSYYSESHQFKVGRGERTGKWELYDLEDDRTELNNVIDKHPELARYLIDKYENWADRIGVVPWQEINRRIGHLD